MATRVKRSGNARPKKKPAARVSSAAAAAQDSRQVIYLYGISRTAPANLQLPEGVDGMAPVEALNIRGMSCWISRVDRGDFADRLSENMENLEWLASAGVRHQRVVGAISAATDVLPARFGTVFLSEAGLREDVEQRKAALQESLDRITGTEEWGVKVFAGERPRVSMMPARSGKEYLQKKAKLLQPGGSRQPDEELESLASELRRVAVDQAKTGAVSGGQRGLQWQASFLVRRDGRRQFQDVLKRFASRWRDARRIECTGPWPPYSFVSSDGR